MSEQVSEAARVIGERLTRLVESECIDLTIAEGACEIDMSLANALDEAGMLANRETPARTPEEFAVEVLAEWWHRTGDNERDLADLIRARDDEVRRHIESEVERLRAGIGRILAGITDDYAADELDALLAPPTEGETDE